MNAKLNNTSPSLPRSLHDQDFYTWALETARAIRERRFAGIDWEAVAEELEDMGRSEARALESQLARLLAHLLKWQYQPNQRQLSENSWRATIENARREIRKLLRENPGLKSRLPELFLEAYPQGIDWAVIETNVSRSVFQSTCPWSLEQAMDDGFWPD
jgi:Domain of unknown function DUF29